MPYVTSVKWIGIEKGMEQGIEKEAIRFLPRLIIKSFQMDPDFVPHFFQVEYKRERGVGGTISGSIQPKRHTGLGRGEAFGRKAAISKSVGRRENGHFYVR